MIVSYVHDGVIKWKHVPRYWSFVRGIHRSLVNSHYKGQGRGALMFSLICASINSWVNNREAGDLIRQCAHYDVIVMFQSLLGWWYRCLGINHGNDRKSLQVCDRQNWIVSLTESIANRVIIWCTWPIYCFVNSTCRPKTQQMVMFCNICPLWR